MQQQFPGQKEFVEVVERFVEATQSELEEVMDEYKGKYRLKFNVGELDRVEVSCERVYYENGRYDKRLMVGKGDDLDDLTSVILIILQAEFVALILEANPGHEFERAARAMPIGLSACRSKSSYRLQVRSTCQ